MNAARPLNVSVAFTPGTARASGTSNPLTHSDCTNAAAAVRRPVLGRKLRREIREFGLGVELFIGNSPSASVGNNKRARLRFGACPTRSRVPPNRHPICVDSFSGCLSSGLVQHFSAKAHLARALSVFVRLFCF